VSDEDETVSRKGDHVDIILEDDVQAKHNAWNDLTLVHEALPEVDREAVDPSAELLNHELELPLMVASMTGGYPGGEEINDRLAKAAAEHGLGMGVGSQRAMLDDPDQARTYEVIADHDVPFVAANIGAPQLIPQDGEAPIDVEDAVHLMEAIDADALIVHLNYLQEVVQPEGDDEAAGVVSALAELVREVPGPVIGKETGAGMHRGTARRLTEAGCSAVDVGGLSGTTFAAVERIRAEAAGADDEAWLGERFRDWGVPTPVAVLEAARTELEVVATGGLRDGVHVANALALGAEVAGMASAVLEPAAESEEALHAFLDRLTAEIETAMFLTGAETVDELRHKPIVADGETRTWLESLGYDVAALGGQRLDA
jgi:isopentenyl-diphosphate delta-isomerase